MNRMGQLEAFLEQIDRRDRDLLASYLETVTSPDPRDPAPVFYMPRSEALDSLLCQLAARADRRCIESVREELKQLQSARNPTLSAVNRGWPRRVAWAIHDHDGLNDRLSGYVSAYLRATLSAVEEIDSGDITEELAVEVDDEPTTPAYYIDSTDLQRQVSQLRLENEVLRRAAVSDPETGLPNQSFLMRRLSEEVSRAGRESSIFSLILVDYVEDEEAEQVTHASARGISTALRKYDICCRTAPTELTILLPGANADACASIVSRIRMQLAEAWPGRPIYIGTATYNMDGKSAGQLLKQADHRRYMDLRRQTEGEIEIGEIPASMVEESRPESSTTTVIWFEGIRQPIRVQAVPTDGGLRMRLPLTFLRIGSSIRFDQGNGIASTGTLQDTVVGGAGNTFPVLQLEVVTSGPERP